MRRLSMPILAAFWATHAGADERLVTALERADTGAATQFIAERFRDAGISVNEGLTWKIEPYLAPINWYDDFLDQIMLAALPTRAESPAYWQNWSTILTEGRWDWRGFFRDGEEAALMGAFNQFYLGAHEYGHALTYRYDPGHQKRWDDEINCREYLADRLAAALLDELAEADARIAGLRSRYGELIAAINAEIAPEHRHQEPDFAALDADCRVMHVEQPTRPDLFVKYGSAFFARQGALLAQDLPPLAALYEEHLLARWRAAQPPASDRGGAVTTLAELPGPAPRANWETSVLPAPDGNAYLLRWQTALRDGGAVWAAFSFGDLAGASETTVPLQKIADGDPSTIITYIVAAAAGPDRFYAMLNGANVDDNPPLLIEASRQGNEWALRTALLRAAPTENAQLAFGPDGALYAFLRTATGDAAYPWRMDRLRIDPRSLSVMETVAMPAAFPQQPLAVSRDGTTYFADRRRVVAGDAAGEALLVVAGSGLRDFKDAADPLAAEFVSIGAATLMHDGALLVTDRQPFSDRFRLRRIELKR